MTEGPAGSGEVHAHISSHPRSERPEAEPDLEVEGEPWDRPETARDDDDAGPSRERFASGRGRAEEVLSEARTRAEDVLHRAADLLDQRTGIVRKVQEHPFAAVGIAFGVGLLAAGTSDNRSRSMIMAKGQVRGMILAGLSSLLMNELRAIAGPYGGVLDAFLMDDEDDDRGPGRGYGRTY